MTVLIAGCGYVGTRLALSLRDAGHPVLALRRDVSALPAELPRVAADLTDRASLEAVPGGITRLVYAASAADGSAEAYRAAYVDGLSNVLDHLLERGDPLERAVFTSSTAVYGQTDGSWVDEASATDPGSHAGEILLEAEARLAEAPIRTVVLRLAGIYGPGRNRLVRSVRDGAARRPAEARYTNRIHRDDCASALQHLLFLEDPAPLYIGVDDTPVDLGEVMAHLAERLGVPIPEVADATTGFGRFSTHKRCSNARLRASGWAPAYPSHREGYADPDGS